MLWPGLVSRVGASHRANLIAPFPLGQNCPRKHCYDYDYDRMRDLLFIFWSAGGKGINLHGNNHSQ